MILPNDAEILAAVYALVSERVQRARAYHGQLPSIRTQEFLDAGPDVQVAALLVLGAAWLLEDPRRADRAELREASHDVHGGDREFWRRAATNHVPYDEIRRRRAEPGPLAREGAA